MNDDQCGQDRLVGCLLTIITIGAVGLFIAYVVSR